MKLTGNCQTTAMGILPHKDIDEAMKIAFSVDIPFWPQLPHVNFYEDMYVQITENFPGITVDDINYRILFDKKHIFTTLMKSMRVVISTFIKKLHICIHIFS